ncbi:MAG: type II toxin-antitoxin system HipA family toxin [Bacteroidaceae bacterium]|nr:type II toxin-antitoxin system HipA family toxin [Bacteroidaceae bacterium]
MKRLLVYADFDWLENIELVGELTMDNIRGGETYGFKFEPAWLKKNGSLILSDDINNYVGMQYTQQGKDIFGCFSDSLPDRWGRTLVLRREQILAAEEKRPVRRLSSMDYLLGIDDASRMGGFRFKETPEGDFINAAHELQIPPITGIRELIAASQEIELSEEKNSLPEKKWLMQLVQPGTSLGGARPKASVVDEMKKLYVAKFPSRKDLYDVGLWEHFAHLMAKSAGISCAETRVITVGSKFHTLLSKRFDRTEDGKRIHFASAMTMLGLTDGQNASTGNGYLDIVDFILQGCCDVDRNLQELYRRVAFNIAIGNTDDHFRNHGFLLTNKGWTLSPAYDLNPTLSYDQSLLINTYTSESSLDILLDSCDDYMLAHKTALTIINQVKQAMSNWQKLATSLGLSTSEQSMFKDRFCSNI